MIPQNKLLLFLLVLIIIPSISALDDLGYARTNQPYNIILGCDYNNTYCPSTFQCNLTVNSQTTQLINSVLMDNYSYPQYNYTLPASNLSENGLYYGRQVCGGSGMSSDYAFQFHVNPQGKDYSNDGTVYIAMFIFLILVFVFSVFAFVRLPYDNPRNELSEIIAVNWNKYLKIGLFVLAYITFIGLTYFAWNISYGVLQFTEMANFFYFIFRTSYIGLIAVLPVTFVFGIISLVKDNKIYNELEKGYTVI